MGQTLVQRGAGGGAGLTSGSVQSGHIASGAVQGFFGDRNIASGSVGVSDFGSGAVIAGTVGSGAIRSGNIASGAVGNFHISSGAVTSGRLGATGTPDGSKFLRDDFTWAAAGAGLSSGAVQSGYVASGAVQGFFGATRNIASGTIGVSDFGSGAVIAGTIGSGAVVSGNIASGVVGSVHIASGAVTSGRLGVTNAPDGTKFLRDDFTWNSPPAAVLTSGAVESGYIASGAVQGFFGATRHVASGTLGVNDFGSGAVIAGTIGSGAVVSGNIASGQVGNNHISSGAVTSGRLGVGGAPDGSKFLRDDFTWAAAGGGLTSGAVQSGYVASGAVQGFFGATRHIASGTVGSFDLGSGAVIATTVGSGAVVSGNIASGQIGWNHVQSGVVLSGGDYDNKLINGGMWFVQRWANAADYSLDANTLVVSGARSGGDRYTADGWKCGVNSGAAIYFNQWDRVFSGAAGDGAITNRFYGAWQVFNSGKFIIYQPMISQESMPLQGRPVIFQAQMRCAVSGIVIRMGVLGLQSGITGGFPNSIVSGWLVGTSGTDPTWASGIALNSPAVDCTVNDSWQVFSIALTPLSGHFNIAPAIWLNYNVGSGTTLHMTEVGLYYD